MEGEQGIASEGRCCLLSVVADYKLLQVTVCIDLESEVILERTHHIVTGCYPLLFFFFLLFADLCLYFSWSFYLFLHGGHPPCFLRLSSLVDFPCLVPSCDTYQRPDQVLNLTFVACVLCFSYLWCLKIHDL